MCAGVAAEKLDAEWTLDLVKIEILARALVPSKNAFGRNKFRDQNVRAKTLCRFGETSCPSRRPSARDRAEIPRQ